MNQPATECDATDRGGRKLDMHTVSRATNNLCDGMRKCSHLGLKLGANRRLAVEKSNKDWQFSLVHERIVFSIRVTREHA